MEILNNEIVEILTNYYIKRFGLFLEPIQEENCPAGVIYYLDY